MRGFGIVLGLVAALAAVDAFAADCRMSFEFTGPGSTAVWKSRGGNPTTFYFRSNSDVNTDGSGRSYHPDDIAATMGLAQNILCNGVNRKTSSGVRSCSAAQGDCQRCLDHYRSVPREKMLRDFTDYFRSFAIATNGKTACVVPEGERNAGFFVSTTSYLRSDKGVCDPERYLDAMVFPAIAVPTSLLSRGVKKGDLALVRNRQNGRSAYGVVYDSSGGRIGESSIAMNRLLLCQKNKPGCEPPPMPTTLKQSYGLVVDDVDYLIFANSVGDWPTSPETVNAAASEVFGKWGGADRLERCAEEYRK
jgi:hypothetical protein